MHIFAFLIILLMTSVSATYAAEKPSVFQLASGEYQPYTSESLPDYGIDNRIVMAAFKNVGIEVKVEFYPWARALKWAKLGKADGTLPWAKRADRDAFFHYSDPIIEVDREYFYSLRTTQYDWDPHLQDYNQLRGKTFSVGVSYNYGEKFQTAEKNGLIEVYRVNKEKQIMGMILGGRVDLAISKRRVANFTLQKHFSQADRSRLKIRPINDNPPTFDYLLISKKSPNAAYFLQSFNTGLKMLRASGEYDAFIAEFETPAAKAQP